MHLVLCWDAMVALSTVVGRIKGASSHAWNLAFPDAPLAWQEGFWAETCAPDVPPELTAYVRDQRARHATGTTDAMDEWSEPPSAG